MDGTISRDGYPPDTLARMQIHAPMKVTDLEEGAANVPVNTVHTARWFTPPATPGVTRHRHTYPDGLHLDALLVNQDSDVLVVNFHGALDRDRYIPPRFERLRTSLELPYSAIFFGDPKVGAHETVALSWYIDYHEVCAAWAVAAAQTIGARHIVFTGSSGGGFAALQSAAHVPGSVALPFNPQTSVHGYRTQDGGWSTQRKYIEIFHRDLAPENIWAIDFSVDWTETLGEAFSAVRRYQRPVPNHVLYATSTIDYHHPVHLPPFLSAAEAGGNRDRVTVYEYNDGQVGHYPPTNVRFHAAVHEAVAMARTGQ